MIICHPCKDGGQSNQRSFKHVCLERKKLEIKGFPLRKQKLGVGVADLGCLFGQNTVHYNSTFHDDKGHGMALTIKLWLFHFYQDFDSSTIVFFFFFFFFTKNY